jgi:para-aminobenzoate synthetase component I
LRESICYLNSNDSSGIFAFGREACINDSSEHALARLQEFLDENKGNYIFGCLNYNLKNEIEQIHSKANDLLKFPLVNFWVPEYVVKIENGRRNYLKGKKTIESEELLNDFFKQDQKETLLSESISFSARTNKENYLKNVVKIKSLLQQGEIYELNYCQEYFAEDVLIKNPFQTYFKLNKLTKAPFSVFLKMDEHFIFCGSPERFLQKKGNKLISQPIKGTAARGNSEKEDLANKKTLQNKQKERSENIMIVDLVRNDFSKIAQKNSVKVDELCAIYSFETVHQMISTVCCEVKENTSFTDIIRATFPMGSMTGAPKLNAMKYIDELENFSRGIYAGSIGYIEPNGDFDFNVIIRSLVFNKEDKYLSCAVGGAITILSEPEEEYAECQIKIGKIINAFNES